MTADLDAAVLGAGPFGLAAGAELARANIESRVFGEVMGGWRLYPQGVLLRSSWEGSSIGRRNGPFSLDAYVAATGKSRLQPIPRDFFESYGRWVAREGVPQGDGRFVRRVEGSNGRFGLILEDGTQLSARRVVVATGLLNHAAPHPPEFSGLPSSLVSHTSVHTDLTPFAGRRVIVIGGGQGAIEPAVLLAEAGAEVELLVRAPTFYYVGGRNHALIPYTHPPDPPVEAKGWRRVRRIIIPPAEIAPLPVSWLIQMPSALRALPEKARDSITWGSETPSAALWLRPRIEHVKITVGTRVLAAAQEGQGVALTLSDRTQRLVDHVLLGTGYRFQVEHDSFLSSGLRALIRTRDGFPLLGPGLESSVPNLHFLGFPAMASYGPLMNTINGSDYSSRLIAHVVRRDRRRRMHRQRNGMGLVR